MQIVAGSEMVHTPASAGKIDGGDFRQAALAPGRVAGALDYTAGNFIRGVGEEFQKNRNTRFALDADLAMRKTKADFTANLAKMPDEGTWLPAWNEQVTNLRSSVLDNPHIGPDLQRQLSANFDVYQQATTAEIRTAAMLKSAKETRDSGIADATLAATQGDLAGATASVQAMVEARAMSPGEAKRFSSRFPSIAAQSQADNLIATAPIGAPEAINKFKGDIDPRVFVRLQATARDAQGRAQSSNLDDFAQDMDASPDGTIDPEVLRKAVSDNQITQRGMNGLLARMDTRKKAVDAQKTKDRIEADRTSREKKNDLMLAADELQYLDDPNVEHKIRDLKADGVALPSAMRRELYEHIDNKQKSAKKTGESEDNPVKRAIFDRMKEDREQNGLTIPLAASVKEAGRSGFLWMNKDPEAISFENVQGGLKTLRDTEKLPDAAIEKRFGKGVTRTQLMAAEQQHFANQNAKMRDWFKANPKATEDEAEKYRQGLERPYLLAATSAELQKRAPVAIQSKEDFDALPSGAKFIHNGKVGTKH